MVYMMTNTETTAAIETLRASVLDLVNFSHEQRADGGSVAKDVARVARFYHRRYGREAAAHVFVICAQEALRAGNKRNAKILADAARDIFAACEAA